MRLADVGELSPAPPGFVRRDHLAPAVLATDRFVLTGSARSHSRSGRSSMRHYFFSASLAASFTPPKAFWTLPSTFSLLPSVVSLASPRTLPAVPWPRLRPPAPRCARQAMSNFAAAPEQPRNILSRRLRTTSAIALLAKSAGQIESPSRDQGVMSTGIGLAQYWSKVHPVTARRLQRPHRRQAERH